MTNDTRKCSELVWTNTITGRCRKMCQCEVCEMGRTYDDVDGNDNDDDADYDDDDVDYVKFQLQIQIAQN